MNTIYKNVSLLIVDDLHLEGRPKEMCDAFAQEITNKVKSIKNDDLIPILVCAGDISEGTNGIKWVQQFDCDIVYVCGNHEFWHGDYYDVLKNIERLTSQPEFNHIKFLHNKTVELYGVRFIGATLWTDLGSSWAWAKKNFIVNHFLSMSDFKQIKARKFYRSGDNVIEMSHYLLNNGIEKDEITNLIASEMFNPYLQITENLKSLEFIEDTLLEGFDGPSVVVSHHLPTSHFWMKKFGMKDTVLLAPYINNRSIYQEYHKKKIAPEKDVLMMGFYVNNNDHLFENPISPDIWVHGHFHKPVDGFLGKTRVISSPAGYVRQSSNITIAQVNMGDTLLSYEKFAINEINNYDWDSKIIETLDELSLLIANLSENIINDDLSPEVMVPIISNYKKLHEKNLKELEQFVSTLLYNQIKIEKNISDVTDQLYITSYLSGFAKWASKNGRVGIDPLNIQLTDSSFLPKNKFIKGVERFKAEHYIGWIEEAERIKSQSAAFKRTVLDFFLMKIEDID